MLQIAGLANLLIAAGHLIGLLWAEEMFAVTGIGPEMEELAVIHPSLPYLLTVAVAVAFSIFGLYGLSGAKKFRPLPWLVPVIFLIAGIYLFRGLGKLIYDTLVNAHTPLEITYSAIASVIGFLYLFGGICLKKKSKY